MSGPAFRAYLEVERRRGFTRDGQIAPERHPVETRKRSKDLVRVPLDEFLHALMQAPNPHHAQAAPVSPKARARFARSPERVEGRRPR